MSEPETDREKILRALNHYNDLAMEMDDHKYFSCRGEAIIELFELESEIQSLQSQLKVMREALENEASYQMENYGLVSKGITVALKETQSEGGL